MKRCHACGKHYITGRKALVLGTMRTVCPRCSEGAIRVVVSVTNAKCTHPHCNETAAVCESHARKRVEAALEGPMTPIVAALRAMIRGLAMVDVKETGVEEYMRGKIEGLESALALAEQAVGS